MTVVLDTSALLMWTLEPGRLSTPARVAIDEADRRLVSSISLWEVGVKVGKGALRLPMTVRDYAEKVHSLEGVEVLPVDWPTWLANLELPWAHRDPADRTIVAVAAGRGCALVTSDQQIRAFYQASVW